MTKKLKMARRFIAAGVMTAFMFVGIASVNAQISDGLIAYWPFDSDLKDAVGDSHGEAMGSDDIAFSQGQWGSGIDLDGVDQFVQTPAENEEMFDFQDGTGFSISAWYKVGEFTKSWQALIAKGEGNRWRIHRRGGENIMTGNGGNGDVPAGTPDINDGEFHHIVLVSDPENDEVRLYSDGELASSNNAPAIQSNENPMMIGENPDARNRTWSGIIDDVGIWNRPLTEDEIAELAGSSIGNLMGGGELVPGMIAYWDFDSAADIEAGLVVDSIAGIEGEVLGDTAAVEGHLGGAVEFGAGNWISVDATDNPWLEPASDANALSVSLWQKLNSRLSSSTFWFGAASANNGERNFQAHIPWGGGDIYFDTAGCCGGGDTRINKASDIDYLEWHHFVFIKDEDHKEIWIDGELFHEGENTGALFDDWTALGIGSNSIGGSNVDGIVDDFGVWARGLDSSEIALIYNGGAGSPLFTAGGGPRIVGKFEANWDDEEEPAGTYMSGVAAVATDEDGENPSMHITDAVNGANGAFTIEDFSRGAVFTDFEMSFRLYMTDSTCCGDGNDAVAGHRPADGMSINIGNDLPDTIGLAEEGSGSGIRICFDTWDSGGGEAPAIDVWRGTEGEVGDGQQGAWSGGMVARQKFNGVTGASEEEKFKDENGDYVWMWTQGEWADVKISILDGTLTINFKGHEVINHPLPAAWAPLVGPNWLFAARTGGANETHWIDDLSIVLYGSTAPGVSYFEADAAGWELQITDIEEAGVDVDSVVVTYEGEVLDVPASKADGVTTIKYASAEILAANSDHALKVAFKDSNGKNQLLNLDFSVKDYLLVDTTVRLDESNKGESGFLVYATQISSGQGVVELHGNNWLNAEKQINGGYIDPDMEEAYLNEADIDSFEGWSYYPEIVETVNQNQDAPAPVGNFNANNGYEDEPLTGIPGWGDSTDGVASEYIALLDLERGAYKLGVNSDDGFHASFGANFGDLLAQTAGIFNGGRGASDTTFEIFIEEAGLYPYRVAWWEGGGGANIEIFSFVNVDGKDTKVLINDPDVEGSIKAYTLTGAVVDESTTVRATTGRAKVLSVAPAPGNTLVKSVAIEVVIQNEDTTVKQDTVVLSLNGEAVDANVSKSGDIVTISYAPDGGLPVGAHTVSISFEESNGITRATDWSFAVPGVYSRSGDVPSEPMGLISVREYHGIGTTDLSSLYASDKFPDSPDVSTFATYFEWPQSGDINVLPPGNVRDNYGWHLMGYLYPPETGEYIFAVATDDNSQLWLSTDESPANAVQLTNESQWTGVRNYFPQSDESTSATVFLEAGKIYFIECFAKEGGGGDNMAVAWSTPEDGPSDVDAGALPISGDYLSPYFSVLDGEPTPILTSSGPVGAAIADAASISATFLNRGVAFTGVSVTVNGVAVEHTLTTDGGDTTIAASPGGVKGMVDVTLSWNGESKSWSYFGHDALGDGPNPIGFWDFNLDIGNGTTIDNVYGLVGQLRNGAAFTDDAHEGTAMDMTAGGNQHVHVAAGEFLNIASSVNQVTVAFWQKNYSIPSTSSFWAEPGRAMQAHVPWSDGQIYWDTAGCCDGVTQRINADATDIGGWGEEMLDTWHHYVFIKNEDVKEIWIDGELFHDGDNIGPLPSDINWLNIGGDAAGNNSLRGVIDDFAVFASALDEDQIMALAEGDRSILPGPPGHPILVSARAGGLPGLASYYVQTVGAVPGPWAFKDGVWVSDGSVAGCGGPYHDFLSSPDYIVSAAGEVSLSVDHRHAFEGGMWDAGQLWISVNGGAYADVGKDAFTANGYTDVAIIGNGIAKGQNGFGNTSAGHADGSYITTTASLGSFAAGDAVSVRFVALYDDCATGAKPNWEVAGVSSDQMVMSSVEGTANLEVVLIKRADALADEKLSVNGQDVATTVATDGSTITITGTAADLMPGTAVATVSYNGQSSSWTFTVPERAINHGDGTITYNGHVAWEWWDGIGGAHPMEALTDNASYPDSPSGATFAPSWNTRTALSGGFEGNGRDNYGGRMSGILTAPETGTYRFFIASDDHGLLRISTDADPANAVSVAEQTGCCNNFEVNDATLSGTVDLVEGNQYYVEALLKEGGGGDWLTIGWRKPSEDIDSAPGGNQEGIPGEYFSSTVRVPALPALSASSSPGDGAVGVAPESTITLSVSNGATTLDVASVSISLDGTKLDHAVAEGSWSRDFAGVSQEGATYSITAATGALGSGSEHAVSISFKDSAGAETTIESGFTVTDVMVLFAEAGTVKYIEVEDFNYDGGSYKTFEEVGLGGSYDGLGAVSGIDFNNSGNASEKYRVIPGNHPGMTESMWDAGRNGFDMTVDFKMGWNDDGDWYNYTRDFPEGGSYAVYGRFSSGGAAIDAKLSIVTGDATAADQATEDVGTFTGPATGGWDTMRFFPLNDASGALAVVELSGVTTVRLSKVAGNMDANYLAFVPYEGSDDPVDISMPGDAVVPTSDNHPAGEHAGLAIDNNAATKYLNFDGANNTASGLTITTGGGVVTGLGLTSANDAPDRDPATFVLSGSNDGATFAEIASGDVPGFLDRFERRTVSFDNDVAYTTYQLIFPTTAGPSTCCMQIAEIELLGTAAEAAPTPTISVVNNGDGTVTVTFEGTLQAAATVNGPWADVDAASPLTLQADQAAQFGRAVSE